MIGVFVIANLDELESIIIISKQNYYYCLDLAQRARLSSSNFEAPSQVRLHARLIIENTRGPRPGGRYLLAAFVRNKEGSKAVMGPLDGPTSTRFPTNPGEQTTLAFCTNGVMPVRCYCKYQFSIGKNIGQFSSVDTQYTRRKAATC